MRTWAAICLIAICFGGCALRNPAGVTISGTVAGHTSDAVVIDGRSLTLAGDGRFLFEIRLEQARIITLEYGEHRIRLFVEPGTRLEVQFDGDDRTNPVFSGGTAAINRYLRTEDSINARLDGVFRIGGESWVELFRQEEAEFIRRVDGFRSLYLDPLASLGDDHPSFVRRTRLRIRLAFDWLLLQYPHFHQKYTGAATRLSAETRAYLDAFDLDDPALLDLEEYAAFGDACLYRAIKQTFEEEKETLERSDHQWLAASLAVVEGRFTRPAVKQFWEFHFLRKHMANNGIKNIGPLVDRFLAGPADPALKDRLRAQYQKEKEGRAGHRIEIYKRVDGFALDAHIFIPDDVAAGERRPAMVHFHGGSWSEGKPDWSFGPSPYGFVSICIEYRTYDRHRALPHQAVADAKSAIRWIRRHAAELHVNPQRIIAAGNSAGGHLALCTALVDGLDEPGEDLRVSAAPDALVLTSAVYDLAGAWFGDRMPDRELIRKLTPLRQIRSGLPPMLIFHGTEDNESSLFSLCERFVAEMKTAGNDVWFHPLENLGHNLWLHGRYWQVAGEANQQFFRTIGWLPSADQATSTKGN